MLSLFDNFLNKKNQYCFNSSWDINAPLEMIWNEVIHYMKWPHWCNGLEKIEPVDTFGHLEKGNHIRSIWKGTLPYSISFDAIIKDFIQYSFLSFNVSGDLYGEGICHFVPSHDNTTINFIWNVSPTKLWMKMSSPFARPAFIKNHDQIIEQAIAGFTHMVEQKAKKTNIANPCMR